MTPTAEQKYRATSASNAKQSNTIPRQMCVKCKQSKPTLGGLRTTALPGRITIHNPARFYCRDCR